MSEQTVMIVDDAASNLQYLQDILIKAGYRVAAFKEGAQALSAAKRTPPDLILLDMAMPEMDGFAVCALLKEDATLQAVPVLFLTTREDSESRLRAFRAGAVDCIAKPFDASDVLARVHTHAALQRRENDLRKAYRQLKVQEKLRDSLVHMTVHDLRNPLSVLKSIFRSLRNESLSRDGTEAVATGARVTNHLVNRVAVILDVSRLESGELQPDRRESDLYRLMQSAIDNTDSIAGERTITLKYHGSGFALQCDPDLTGRVIENLVSNAIHHTCDQEGRVSLVLEKREHDMLASVSDNGPGIPSEYKEVIFEKFGQVKAGDQTTGLGLPFAKMAVEAHGGTIGVESDGKSGSTFWFTLPY